VGGGIAGCGAAWALQRSGFEVHVFEAAEAVGGNAKTFEWDDGVVTGLSVLAWPERYFRNYQRLLGELGILQTDVDLGFFVRSADGEGFETGNLDGGLNRKHAADLETWQRMVERVRWINACFVREGPSAEPSLYSMSMLNPLNVVPLRWVARLSGVSSSFWTDVVVPMYASTFLSVNLDAIPAVIVPIVWDIMPLNRAPRLKSWTGNSRAVFDGLTKNVIVHTGFTVTSVRRDKSGGRLWRVNNERGFHRVVFASSARHVAACTEALPFGHRALFDGIRYTQHDDPSFVEGLIHTDSESVFPHELHDRLLERHANFIDARRERGAGGDVQYANTFILSSWYPEALRSGRRTPRLVTYNADPAHSPRPEKVVGKVANVWNHPALSATNLACLYLLRLVQGREGLYFCGSLATPGNGHDLSLCSGLAVARAIGAEYPFVDDAACLSDMVRLAGIMGL